MVGGLMRWLLLFAAGVVFLFACVFNPGLAWSIVVISGGGWIAYRWMRKRREVERHQKISNAISRCVEAHRNHLLRSREQGIFLDEYGKLEETAWRKEVKRFTQRVVLDEVPETRAFSEHSIIEFTRKTIEKCLGLASPQARQLGF